ncbi:ParB/RepB/Spo0J family partition protein [Porphyrobacter sp. ULC335]|uniref:ParB/RepB/Spo0J family partition protein n=1 Tax=Porphyrobacter sp. ULC335 TaxID=2854260 RepID=UPI00221F71F6|nr:ParB N-terminal domain-containing protein [Porphyrobacter sp. ULC335]UYV16667.1 ParB N-terminal domain-containing protein [Porphyrobacter sp. ULC335]
MQIDHIPLGQLSVAAINMRRGRKVPDVSDILPSVKARGVLAPLFVRPSGAPDHFEILAGKRRYFASLEAAREAGEERSLPCIVVGADDDAEALEISMIENLLREDPDEVTQWESFTRLAREGRSIADIAATFALTELKVKRILALGNLLPRIREAYRSEAIDAATVRHLTLASKAQQTAWLALFEDAEAHAPRGSQLKAWLFGGASIATSVALFDLETYAGQIVTDLFGEEGWFADADAFWAAQQAAVEARKAEYLAAGWADVVIVPVTGHFASWEYECAGKRKGGKVYIQLRRDGEVVFHEGYISRREVEAAARRARGEDESAKPARPEMTATLASYADLHRQAAVGAQLASTPALALRVMVAHAIAGSPLWSVRPADTASRNAAIAASLAAAPATRALAEQRRAVLRLLGMDEARVGLCQDRYGSDLVPVLHRLIALSDAEVMQVLVLVMAETLAIGSEAVEYLGEHCGIDMADHWQADEAFLGLLRDREVMLAILAETGGAAVASANAGEKGATLKGLIADHLTGANDRPKCVRWVPRWMAFPPSAYTGRDGVPMVAAARRAQWMITDEQAETEKNEALASDTATHDDAPADEAQPASPDSPQGAALAA